MNDSSRGLRRVEVGCGERVVESAGMDALMTSHAAFPFEFLTAIRARVRLFAGVQPHVGFEIGLAGKLLLAALKLALMNACDFDGS